MLLTCLLRYILDTCLNLSFRRVGGGGLGGDDNGVFTVPRHGLLRYILHIKLWCNPCSECYGMDCFGTYFTHVQTCDAETCDDVRVQSAIRNALLRNIPYACRNLSWRLCSKCYTQCTASQHILRMPKPVMAFVFKLPRNGLLCFFLFDAAPVFLRVVITYITLLYLTLQT